MKKIISIFSLLVASLFAAPTTPINNAVLQGTTHVSTSTGATITGTSGSVEVTAGATNNPVSILSAGTFGVGINTSGAAAASLLVWGKSVATTPNYATWLPAGVPVASFFSEGGSSNNQLSFVNAGATGTNMVFSTSAGTLATPTAMVDGNFVFRLIGSQYDGAAFRNTAGIDFQTDGSVSSGTAPQRIAFLTGPTTARIERMRISAAGTVFMGAGASTTSTTFTTPEGALSFTGGPGSMTITSGTGNSRTMTLRTTTSGGTATNALVLGTTQVPSFPQSRKAVTSQFDSSSGTTPADVTGLSVALPASGTFSFRAVLHINADATGGEKLAAAYSGTSSAIIYQIDSVANATNLNVINSRQTASAGAAGTAGATAYFTTIEGTITSTGVGNLTIQFSRNAATGTSSVLVGSYLEVVGF